LRIVVLAVAKFLFYLYGLLWTLRPRRAGTVKDVLNLFYLGFLGLDGGDVEVVRFDHFELVTRCRNPCLILRLSLMLKIDTRVACRMVSEPVCKYVLHKLNPRLAFERNYNHIRPYSESCEERVYFKG
jgi:hypothetical protein